MRQVTFLRGMPGCVKNALIIKMRELKFNDGPLSEKALASPSRHKMTKEKKNTQQFLYKKMLDSVTQRRKMGPIISAI